MKRYYLKIAGAIIALTLVYSCQNIDRPELSDNYPKDINAVGGPLNFYVAFDGKSNNPLMNAVDSVRAKFPSDNPLSSIDGPSSKALQCENYKYVKYSSANDFAAKAGSFTVAFWQKKTVMKTSHIFSMPAVDGYHWSGAAMFLLTEGSVASPVVKLFVNDSKGDKFFEWVGSNTVSGIYDGNWHQMAFCYDGTTSKMTLYVDGKATPYAPEWNGHGNITLEPSKIIGLKIGAGPQEFTPTEIKDKADDWLKNSWNGGIDQFRLYSIALTASDVQKLYTKKR